MRSEFEAEAKASVLLAIVLEGEGEAVSSGGSEAGDEVLISEFNGISISIRLLELDTFRVEEDSIELDVDINSAELGIISSSTELYD